MKSTDFKFSLPKNLIAQHPKTPRDECKLMVIGRKSKEIDSKKFKDIADYIDEGDTLVVNDSKVFAQNVGSVAAPTAGIHFTKELIRKLEKKGVNIIPVTLHIGLGTFRPVEVEDLTKHRMDSEFFYISDESASMVNQTVENRKK